MRNVTVAGSKDSSCSLPTLHHKTSGAFAYVTSIDILQQTVSRQHEALTSLMQSANRIHTRHANPRTQLAHISKILLA